MLAPPRAPSALAEGFRSLRSRNYRLFWLGQLVSLAGTWMQDVALSFRRYCLDQSLLDFSLQVVRDPDLQPVP